MESIEFNERAKKIHQTKFIGKIFPFTYHMIQRIALSHRERERHTPCWWDPIKCVFSDIRIIYFASLCFVSTVCSRQINVCDCLEALNAWCRGGWWHFIGIIQQCQWLYFDDWTGILSMWEIAPRTNQLNNNDNTDEETQREEKHTESVCVCVLPSKWWQWWREQIYNKYSDISLTHTQIRIKWMNLSFSNSIRTAESEIGSIWIYIRRRAKCETLWERGRSTHMGQRTAQIERKTLLRSKNTQAEEKHKSRKKNVSHQS